MRHSFIISAVTVLIAAICYLLVDVVSNDTRAAVGTLTITGLTTLVLCSAHYAHELRKGS